MNFWNVSVNAVTKETTSKHKSTKLSIKMRFSDVQISKSKLYRVSPKNYSRLMSRKKVTIGSMLKILLGFNSKILKLDYDLKNKHCRSLSITQLRLKQSASL